MAEPTPIKTDPDSVSENIEPQSVKGEQTQQNPKRLESTEGVNAFEPEALEPDSFLNALVENNQNKAPAQDNNQADVEALQQLIAEGADPTQLLEETAAGEGEPTDGGGIYIPTIERTAEEVLADAGFDTTTTVSNDVVEEEVLITAPVVIDRPDNGVEILDLMPAVDGGEATVYDANLSDGTSPDTSVLTQVRNFTMSAPDGLGTLTFGGVVIDASGVTGNIVTTGLFNKILVTGYNEITGVVTYEYTLLDNEAHTQPGNDNSLFDSVDVVLTDSDGDTDSDILSIKVIDDTPEVVADTGSVGEGTLLTVLAAGGVLANDTSGADDWTASNAGVVGVVAGSATGTDRDDAAGTLNQGITGTYGTLTLQADGSYIYQATANAVTADATDTFVYTVKDGDGDLTSTTLTITVADVTGTPADTTGQVDEAGLLSGTANDTSDQVINGSLSLQSGWSVASAQNGTASFGDWSVATDGTYNYTLTTATTDVDAAVETDRFSYTATANGNTVTNTVTITIVDDTPVFSRVNDDEDLDSVVSISAPNPASNTTYTDQFADWDFGADGFQIANVTLPTGTEIVPIATDGSQVVINLKEDGDVVGVLTLNADGPDSLEVFHRDSDVQFSLISNTVADGGGPTGTYLVDLGSLAFNIAVTADDGDSPNEDDKNDIVNTSSQGWGVKGNGGQTVDEDESLLFKFVDDNNNTGYSIDDFRFKASGFAGGIGGIADINVVVWLDAAGTSTDTISISSNEDVVVQISEIVTDFGGAWTNSLYDSGDPIYAVQIISEEAGGGKFRINEIGVGEQSVTPPDDLAFENITLQIVDGDGDSVSQHFSVFIDGEAGVFSLETTGGSGDDNIVGGIGNNIVDGGVGADVLTGGDGADIFIWHSGDETGSPKDTITDWGTGSDNDKLDLSDLLQWETTATLGDFLEFSYTNSNTTLMIDVDGLGGGTDQQIIVFEGVNLPLLGDDQAIIDNLLNSSQLITDN
jgi:VCBS repeat-containing protein